MSTPVAKSAITTKRASCRRQRFTTLPPGKRGLYHVCWGLAMLTLVSAARAESGYEARLTDWALAQTGRVLEPSPEGKRIEEVLIVRENIVGAADPYPAVLNLLHHKTRESVVRAEVVFHEGELFDAARVEETERNLRRLPILALARVLPLQGRAGGVALLVVTRDLWSLRFNSSYQLVGTLLEFLRVHPTEQNFLGLNAQLSGDFQLRLDAFSVGEALVYPRMGGTVLSLSENASIIFNRQTKAAEGSSGALNFGKPLYTLEDTWGFNVGAGWNVRPVRFYQGASLFLVPAPDGAGGTTPVPDVYDAREASATAGITRSLGVRYKTDVTLGLGAYGHHYGVPSTLVAPDARSYFAATYLPRSESASFVSASVHAFEARYVVLHDVESFALSEDYQLGYEVLAGARWADRAFFSPTRFVEGGAAVGYTFFGRDDLLQLRGAAATRWQIGASGTGTLGTFVNRQEAAQLMNVFPFTGFGRFVARALLDFKEADLTHTPLFLGGDDGLRGTAPQAFTGTRELLVNVEFRTRPVELWTLHLGGVLFFDAGSAYSGSPFLAESVGFGIRALFPQFNLVPIQVDFGYVFRGPRPPFVDRFASSLGQVTDAAPAFLAQPF